MDSLQERYDNVLLGILQNEGQINGFLDAVIGFLYRRYLYFFILQPYNYKFLVGTHFYIIAQTSFKDFLLF